MDMHESIRLFSWVWISSNMMVGTKYVLHSYSNIIIIELGLNVWFVFYMDTDTTRRNVQTVWSR